MVEEIVGSIFYLKVNTISRFSSNFLLKGFCFVLTFRMCPIFNILIPYARR